MSLLIKLIQVSLENRLELSSNSSVEKWQNIYNEA